MRRCRVLFSALLLLLAVGPQSPAQHYGFGLMGRTTVTLHRRLAPDYNLHDTSFRIKVEGRGDPQRLATILQGEILRYGTNLQWNDKTPAVEIDCIITSFTPPVVQITGQAPAAGKLKLSLGQSNVQQVHLSGAITASYRALNANGTGLVAGQDTARVEGTYNVTADGKHFYKTQSAGDLLKVFGRSSGTEPIPTQEELVQQIEAEEARLVASHLVAETQTISVLLAGGGALDQANKRAEAGQWAPYLEMLEAIPPLGKPEDEAYRRYDVGVANEALAYAAEDVSSARKFLEVASTAYGKALEEKPGEKNLLEPQNRIQTAIEHYAAIAKQTDERARMLAQFKQQQQSVQGQGAGTGQVQQASMSDVRPASGGSDGAAPGASAAKPAGEVMTNDSVMKLVSAKFSEHMIVNKIQSSSRAQFDTSVDAMVKLKHSGVSDTIIQAMDSRMEKQGQR